MNEMRFQSSDLIALIVVIATLAMGWYGKMASTDLAIVLGGVLVYLKLDREKEG